MKKPRLCPRLMAILSLVLTTAGHVAQAQGPTDPITFSHQIAPLIYANCTACHREGEAAPFPLASYADIKKHAQQIADVTARRIKPPWKAEHGHHDFVGERRLTDEQIALIQQWVKQDCPEGDATAAPHPPEFTTGWQLGEPDMIVKMSAPYALAAEGRDVYRCFVIPMELPEGKYLRAVEYRPSNRKIVHHALLTTVPRELSMLRLALSDGKSFSSGLVPPGQRLPGPLGIWTPGMQPQPLPDGFAAPWPIGADLVIQLHLHPSGKPETEQSSIGLHLTDQKPHGRLRSLVMLDKRIDIAPGNASYSVDRSMILKFPAEAYGIFPHMHLLGRTVSVTALLPDGTSTPLISVGDWDFNWQNYYQYASPLKLPSGTRLDAHWTFDNSAANPANPSTPPNRVKFGEQTTNEMAALILDVIPTGPEVKGAQR